MIALLEGDIARLQQTFADPANAPPALAAWLEQLESQYAMAEQRDSHGSEAHDAPPAPAGEGKEATFF